jgi:hypothetical protein
VSVFEAAADRLVAEDSSVQRGRAMQNEGVKIGGKLFGFAYKGGVVVKLPADRVGELIASGEGAVFDRGQGTPMREWVRVDPADEAACVAYLREARAFVSAK